MPEPVLCDVCGKLFSSRHVKSHKRLAHGKDAGAAASVGQDRMKAILEIYRTLSVENKRELRARLADLENEHS